MLYSNQQCSYQPLDMLFGLRILPNKAMLTSRICVPGREKFKIDQSHLTWHANPITLRRSLLQHRDGMCPAKLARPSTSELPLESTPTTPTPTIISTQVVTQSPIAIKPLTDELHHASPEITSFPPTIGILQGPGDRPLIWVDGRRVP